MNRLVLIVTVALLLGGCERSPYAGYKAVGDDVHLRLLALGDGEALPSDSDSVVVRLRLGQHGGEVGGLFSTERAYLVKDIRSGALKQALNRLHVGDSMSVIAPGASWPWSVIAEGAEPDVPDTGKVQGEISLRTLRTPAMMRAEAEMLKRDDPLGYELRLIAAYIGREGAPYVRWGTSDIHHHITGTPSDTSAVSVGDQVTISYQGRSIEGGRLFDDTGRNGAPLTFTYGDKDQVINGLEVAVRLLREGQEGSFVLPSLYAFGAKGIAGVLEPHSPVVYTVRLEKVVRAKGA
ncbi:MAG: FKBP-type peptidyl-prolyl cis-trans isomerase [Flavobacteriales bacterium]|nr:FKBP-type peptidyl-prolyl cis-trans isomerase [Flavobacteriales bacterium]